MRGPKMAQGAAQANNLEILRALLDAGADLSLEDECRQGSGLVFLLPCGILSATWAQVDTPTLCQPVWVFENR